MTHSRKNVRQVEDPSRSRRVENPSCIRRVMHRPQGCLAEVAGLLGVSLSGGAGRLVSSVEPQAEPKVVSLDPDPGIV